MDSTHPDFLDMRAQHYAVDENDQSEQACDTDIEHIADDDNRAALPMTDRIKMQLVPLIQDARPGDKLVFYFASPGESIFDINERVASLTKDLEKQHTKLGVTLDGFEASNNTPTSGWCSEEHIIPLGSAKPPTPLNMHSEYEAAISDRGEHEFQFYLNDLSMQVVVPNQQVYAIGGSGRVFKAYGVSNRTTTHPLAVKISQDLEIVDRELSIWRTLRHENLLTLLGVHVISTSLPGTRIFLFVSPFMRNGNLSDYIALNMHVDRLVILRDVANALTYLHDDARVVHGDIKPENVLIGDDSRGVLADFGLSTTVSAGSNLTAQQIRERYTPAYTAPEIVDDAAEDPSAPGVKRSKTRMSDVYAVGMLIYELYAGRTSPGSRYRMMGDLFDGKLPPRPVATSSAWVLCDDLWSICERCWQVRPSDRPTAAAILCRLRNLPPRQLLVKDSAADAQEITPVCHLDAEGSSQ